MACLNNVASFRCKNCGHLEDSGHAGENLIPHACSACGAGVIMSPGVAKISRELCEPDLSAERRVELARQLEKIARGAGGDKQYDAANWEILSECDDARLKSLGITRAQVAVHAPAKLTTPRQGVAIAREAAESLASKDKV